MTRTALVRLAKLYAPQVLPPAWWWAQPGCWTLEDWAGDDWAEQVTHTVLEQLRRTPAQLAGPVSAPAPQAQLTAPAQLAALASAPAPPSVQEAGAWYTSRNLPPGAASWRAARETAHREGLPVARVGRTAAIDRAAWDAWIRGRAVVSAPRPPSLGAADAARLARLGLVQGEAP